MSPSCDTSLPLITTEESSHRFSLDHVFRLINSDIFSALEYIGDDHIAAIWPAIDPAYS